MEFFRRISFNYLIYISLLIGCFLRSYQYFYNRSLWGDEYHLAVKIVTEPLLNFFIYQGGQVAPPLFLLSIRILTDFFGNSDYILRLLPFICGIASLFLFRSVSQYLLSKPFQLFALLLFCFTDNLIYYSSELKQYHVDVTLSLVIFWLYLRFLRGPSSKLFFSLLTLGGLFIWFSHAIIFSIATIGLHLLFQSKTLFNFKKKVFLLSIWTTSFLLFYFFSVFNINQSEGLKEYWHIAFMPLIPTTFSEFIWLPLNLFRLSCYFLGLRLESLPLSIYQDLPLTLNLKLLIDFDYINIFGYIFFFGTLFFVLFLNGIFGLFKYRKSDFFLLVVPLIFVLAASSLKKYPFQGRLLLFYLPYMTLIIAYSVSLCVKTIMRLKLSSYKKNGLICLLLLSIFFNPIQSSIQHLMTPRSLDYSKRILSYLDKYELPSTIISIGSNSMNYYCKEKNLNYSHIKIKDFSKPLPNNDFKKVKNATGIVTLNFSKAYELEKYTHYFYTHYTVKNRVTISNLATILYLDIF